MIKARNLFLQAYIFIMALIYPLYVRGSYSTIGKDKYLFYKYVTISMLLIIFILSILIFIKNKGKDLNYSVTDLLILLFMGALILSTAFSKYPETALAGTEGWYMGLETLLLILATYLFLSCTWSYSGYVWAGFLAGSLIVYILGICNRFSVYPIPFEKMAPDFISTLGNINWFCSYFAVMWPIGACLYIFSQSKKIRTAAGIYTAVAFASGVTQGSSSAFLSFIGVFYLLLYICIGNRTYRKRWLGLAAYWCLVCQAVRILRTAFPSAYNYETDNLCGMATGTSFTIGLLVILAGLYLLWNKRDPGCVWVKRLLMILPAGMIGIYIFLLAANTLLPEGLPAIAENSLFLFDQSWGSARGATWATGMELIYRMPLWQKLLGVGPDCFVEYLYECPDIMEKIWSIFGGAVLKNAHNEWLTMMVNTGILGSVIYIGIFLSFIIRFMKKGIYSPVFYIPAACAFSYMIHNMVSFGQVLNMPFIFIIMGIGESCFKQCFNQGGEGNMRKLRESERGNILDYIMAEPEINLFFIGDMENYGIESDEVSVYAEEEGGLWDSLILRYFDNYIIYSQKDTFRVEPIIEFLQNKIIDSMNGKAGILLRIAPFFPKMRLDLEYMCRCNHIIKAVQAADDGELRSLSGKDAEEIVDLYLSIREVAPRFERRDKKIAERRANLERDGFGMGFYKEGRLVSVAEISADSDKCGMIIGVATHPDFMGKGYATRTATALCEEAFARGKEFLCVFYDNPDIGRIYRKIGFEEMEKYALMY